MIEKCDKCHEIVYDSKDEKRYQVTKIINYLILYENCQEFQEYEDFKSDLD